MSSGTIDPFILRIARLITPACVGAVVSVAFIHLEPSAAGEVIGLACGALAGATAATLLSPGLVGARSSPEEPDEQHAVTPDPPPAALLPRQSTEAYLGGGLAVLDAMPAMALLLDRSGAVVFANASAHEEFAGEDGRAPIGAHFTSFLRARELVKATHAALLEGEPAQLAFSQRRGRERRFFAIIRALPSSPSAAEVIDGRAPQVLLMLEDHTRAHRTEELHRNLVANASHELKTPLAAISGAIETLRGPARDDPEAQERFLRMLSEQSNRMRTLMQDLLSLNKIELNEHVPPIEQVDLLPILEQCAHLAPGEVLLELPTRIELVRGDESELAQLFTNLISNAIKYGGDKRPPVVRLAQSPQDGHRSMVGVTVEDYGPGVAKEHQPRLMERFYRAPDPLGRKLPGTGLGLAIVRHVIMHHRGTCEIDSDLGRGTRFTVWLPQYDQRIHREGASQA